MEKIAYVFTITRLNSLLDIFQVSEPADNEGLFFVASKFANKEEAMDFARDVEQIKFENDELNYIIKPTYDIGYNLFLTGKLRTIDPVLNKSKY